MSQKKLVVIGGDAAGMSAASKVRREQPERKIVVFERGKFTSYAACGMPYFIAGEVDTYDSLIARTPEEFRNEHDIDVHVLHEVVQIDPNGKQVRVKNLQDGDEFWDSYDDLLIATGASPIIPDVPGLDSKGIFSLSVLQTGIDVFEDIEKSKPKEAVIVGGGYIGIEMAEALLNRGMKVTLIDMAPQVMPTMDPDMAELISDYMIRQGIEVYLEEKLDHFNKNENGRVQAVVTDKQEIEAGLVIMGLGVKPNSRLAEEAGLKLGASDAIRVNKKLETSAENIWAAGDCAESYHLVSEKKVFIALGTVASKHGVVAGINLSGGDIEFPGVVGTAITKMKDLEISRTGLSEKEASGLGIEYKTETIESRTRSGYYPGSDKITVKLVAERKSGVIIGGQIIGMKGSAKRIDTIATAITAKMTAQNITDLDLSYAPPFSPVWDPVQIAARRLV
jgi:NADPH-dependent 2,4-dienoyl-CoA reductase/sulfur reductase-like enzyme